MSALLPKADIQELVRNYTFIFGTMSAFGGKADIISYGPKSPFIAKSGHSTKRFAVQC